ncbi:hypothetical protein ACSVH2_07835 [Flavobacterium sp. RSB2_4_14]|uniref:hypothetical protein n=1 Tax=Flavobacterium sp. RSB2_4_14 TaxID=3447665 RepID=UPI003F2CE140
MNRFIIIFLLTFSSCFSQNDKTNASSKSRIKFQKKVFNNLKIGDTIKIPFGTQTNYEKEGNTDLIVYSIYSDMKNYECIIEGVVLSKNKKNNGYNIQYKITNIDLCKFDKIVHYTRKVKGSEIVNNMKEMKVGEILIHNIKYYKLLN